MVLFPLGKGGMGEVWAAVPAVGPGAPIALKILHRDRHGTDDALMFRDEARAAMALRHPAIVSSQDMGEAEGRHYMAMTLVRGPSLSALLQRVVVAEDRLAPNLIAHLGIQVGRALEHAWGQASLGGQPLRLVHRDVSPHNILIDQQGRVRLTDFGVARTDIQEHQSRVGTVRGKPSYMAPEQVTGGTLDNRTDVFALGIVLYECVALRRLFGRKTAVKSMDAVLRHVPRPLMELVPGTPAPLASAIERALEKRPAERYRSAAEMVEALQQAAETLEGAPEAGLRRKIARHFEAEAFDAEARGEEARAIARHRAEAARHRPESAPPEPATRIWPTALGADPLAPEALEEVRTFYRPVSTFSGRPRVHPEESRSRSESRSRAGSRSSAHSRSFAESRSSFTGTATGTQGPGRTTALLWLAAAMVVGVAAAVAGTRWGLRTPVAAPAENRPPTAAHESPAPPSSLPAPSAIRVPPPRRPTGRASRPSRAELPAPRPVQPGPGPVPSLPEGSTSSLPEGSGPALGGGTLSEKARRGSSAASARRPSRRSARPSGAPRPASPDAAAELRAQPVTYEAVRKLVRRVRAIDPAVGGEMLATLIEAGQHNADLHRRLEARARAFLAERGTE